MNPLLLIGLLVGGAVAISLIKTSRTAVNMQYAVTRFGIYKFATNGNLVLRVRVRFTNAESSPLHVNLFDIQAYINPQTQTVGGKTEVVSRGSLLASMSDASGFVINANNFTDKDFYINVRWADVGKYFVSNAASLISLITNSTSIMNFVRQMAGTPILINGTVKAENISIPLQQVVQLQNDMQ